MRRFPVIYDNNFLLYPFFQFPQQSRILLRQQDAEAQIAFIEEGEGGGITDEHFFGNTFFKKLMRRDAFRLQAQKDEIRLGGICLDIFPCGKLCKGFFAFCGNQCLRLPMKSRIAEDALADEIRKAVHAPWILMRLQMIEEGGI